MNWRDPTANEMRAHLHEECRSADFDDFDVEAAIYWFASDYHGGQASNLYSALSTSEYHPGPLCTGADHEGDSVLMAYNYLVDEYAPNDPREESESC